MAGKKLKKKDKLYRGMAIKNHAAQELANPKFRQRIIQDKRRKTTEQVKDKEINDA